MEKIRKNKKFNYIHLKLQEGEFDDTLAYYSSRGWELAFIREFLDGKRSNEHMCECIFKKPNNTDADISCDQVIKIQKILYEIDILICSIASSIEKGEIEIGYVNKWADKIDYMIKSLRHEK